MADDENFLSRWSRRKQRGRAAEVPESEASAGVRPEEAAPADPEAGEARRREVVDNLPDPERLGPDDDFSQFMQDEVPEELRQRALRRLWRSNPVFANLDGLNDYDLDYTDAATVVKNLKTAFQVGRGMVTQEERVAEAAARDQAAAGGSQTSAEEAAPERVHSDVANPSAPSEEPPDPAGESPDAAETAETAAMDEATRPPRRFGPVGSEDGEGGDGPPAKGRAAKRRWGAA